MTPERWSRIKSLFHAAVALPPDERPAILIPTTQEEPTVRDEVQRLLANFEAANGFLEEPVNEPTQRFATGELIANRYRILRLLGEGGMGEVFEAEDKELGGRVALKVLHADFREDNNAVRLRREIQVMRQINHPNVCRVFDVGRHGDDGRNSVLFFTMELLDGEILAARLRREGAMQTREALPIIQQLCRGIAAAHRVGILHRDFKSSNIMLVPEQEKTRTVILDFGLAKSTQPSKAETSERTVTGPVQGTPDYLAPEQLLCGTLTTSTDIYALGIVMFQMVTGSLPFTGESAWVRALKRLSEPPPRIHSSNVPRRWKAAIHRCLERDPAKRFASAEEVAVTLEGSEYSFTKFWKYCVAAIALAVAVSAASWFYLLRPALPRVPEEKRVAVLAFRSQNAAPGDGAFSEGLAQSLTFRLSQVQQFDKHLWVFPASHALTKTISDPAKAYGLLGINLVITGTVTRSGENLRVETELLDARSMHRLRHSSVELPSSRAHQIERLLLNQQIQMLGVQNVPAMLGSSEADRTPTPGAYEFHEQAKGYLQRYGEGPVTQAIEVLKKAVAIDGQFAPAHATLARAYLKRFDHTQELAWLPLARQSCERAMALNDQIADSHAAQAMYFLKTGDINGAIRRYTFALNADPGVYEYRTELAQALDKAGNLLQAEETYREAIRMSPESWLGYNNLGEFYFRHGQYARAEPLFKTVTELAPDNPLGYSNSGGTLLMLGDNAAAEKVLRRAIAIQPTGSALTNLGTALQYQGQLPEAVQMYAKAAELTPRNHLYWRNLGDGQLKIGRTAEALASYKRAVREIDALLEIRPADADLLSRSAVYLAKVGEKRSALQTISRALAISSGPSILFRSAVVREMCGDREKALVAVSAAHAAGYSGADIQQADELAALRQDARFGLRTKQ